MPKRPQAIGAGGKGEAKKPVKNKHRPNLALTQVQIALRCDDRR